LGCGPGCRASRFNGVPDSYYFADAVVDFQPPSKQYLVSAEHTQEALLQLAEQLDRAVGLAIEDHIAAQGGAICA
jgi:hypothetical protein